MKKNKEKIENWEKEGWGGWKIVSEMLDNPDKTGIYSTSKCYKKLYDFVVAQKKKARQKERQRVLEEIKQIMMDTLSADTPTYHKEVNLLYQKLDKLKMIEK